MTAPSDEAVRAVVLRVLVEQGRPVPGADGRLDMDSLTVVALVDALEMTLEVRLRPEDVNAANLGTLSAVADLCRRRASR